MSQRIIYHDDGTKTCYIDDRTVTEDEFFDRGSGRLGAMLAEQRAPQGVSDCTFMHGAGNGSQFDGQQHVGNYYKHITERDGGNTNGKKYLSGLARYPGDPEAWVDSRGDVQKILEKRGWGSEGTINVKPRESLNPQAACPDVADDLLNKYTAEIASRDPNPHLVDTADLKEQVRERLSPKKKRKESTKATVA